MDIIALIEKDLSKQSRISGLKKKYTELDEEQIDELDDI